MVAVNVTVPGENQPEPLRDVALLVDTSGSTQGERLREITRALVKRMRDAGSDSKAALVTFNQRAHTVFSGSASGLSAVLGDRLEVVSSLGATDLGRALDTALGLVKTSAFRRVVLISDGLVTLGVDDSLRLQQKVLALRGAGVVRFDAITPSLVYDGALLHKLVTAGFPEVGVVITPDQPDLERLERRTVDAVRINLDHASEQYPWVVPGVQPGDLVTVQARLSTERPIRLSVGDAKPSTFEPRPVLPTLLERSIAHAQIEALAARAQDAAVAELSLRHHVLAPNTGFLVLEDEWQFDDYRIPRNRSSKIMSITEGKLHAITPAARPRWRPPVLRYGSTMVSGRLPPEIIQHIIRSNWGRFRGCYLQGLLPNPRLRGRVVVHFVIDDDGQVEVVHDQGSTLPNRNVTECIVKAFGELRYPEPQGGKVNVVYPLVLAPEDQERGEPADLPPQVPVPSYYPARKPPILGEATEGLSGCYAAVVAALDGNRGREALEIAESYVRQEPSGLLGLVALGHAAASSGNTAKARLSFGSLIDRFPERAEVRRFAAQQLMSFDSDEARALALDSLEKAQRLRPDQVHGQRQLAYALVTQRKYQRALDILADAIRLPLAEDAIRRLLKHDLRVISRAALANEPNRQAELMARLKQFGLTYATERSTTFVLTWENDNSDLDLFVERDSGKKSTFEDGYDAKSGYGPEFLRLTPSPPYLSYLLLVEYQNQRSSGYALGSVQIVDHDGQGDLSVVTRPFVIMQPGGRVLVGKYTVH
jgi:hypothetical protein